MVEEAFEAAIQEARRLEKKMIEYAPYKGDIYIETTIELEPKEYVELTYDDLFNLYERAQKIISTREMGILAAGEEEKVEVPTPETEEVESRLREMTTETLKEAEEVAKEPKPEIEKPPPEVPPITEMVEAEIELEKAPPEEEAKPEIEIEKPEVPEIELEKPPEEKVEIEKPVEKPKVPEIEVPEEKKEVPPPVPPVLRESPDEAAARRYRQMEEQILSMLGEKADELTLKKKMLELTKQLFKEKTTSKREEIKLQITVLKNILVSAKAKPPKARVRKEETHEKLFDTMISTQQAEIARKKDEIVGTYNKKIADVKKKFYDDISVAEEPAKRKQIYEGFVFSVTSLVEQLPDVIKKHKEFTMKKHAAEMEKLGDSLSEKEKGTRTKVDERLDYINNQYDAEFSAVKGIVGRDIDNLIEVTGGEIFKVPEEKPKDKETIALEVVKEINETDEGTLLYYLHSQDPAYYKRYERKQISKAEAIFEAKALLAKEKGLSDSMVKRYFSQTED